MTVIINYKYPHFSLTWFRFVSTAKFGAVMDDVSTRIIFLHYDMEM